MRILAAAIMSNGLNHRPTYTDQTEVQDTDSQHTLKVSGLENSRAEQFSDRRVVHV